MRLCSFEHKGRVSVGLVRETGVIDVGARLGEDFSSIRRVIERNALANINSLSELAPDFGLKEIKFLPTIPNADKYICIGVNYVNRNAEYRDDSALAKFPSVFMRTRESFVGHNTCLWRPPESTQLDYEGEIAIIIGREGRRIKRSEASQYVAGLSLINEGSIRDWLRHAKFNVTQGKNFERSGSMGPWMVSADEFEAYDALSLRTDVNDETRQSDTTANLLFPFDYLISYLSSFMRLMPGDVISTGTPNGAGARFDPPRYLRPGDEVRVSCPDIGELMNCIEDEPV